MVPMNFYQCWKAKLERPHFFKIQSGKITVCTKCSKSKTWLTIIATYAPTFLGYNNSILGIVVILKYLYNSSRLPTHILIASYNHESTYVSWRVMLSDDHYGNMYGLLSFQMGGTKLGRFLPKNQYTQWKEIIEFWELE